MASDEQRVRTVCGWIGVEISRSRVRTPGKVGYGLWRVRGSVDHRTRVELGGLIPGAVTPDGKAERGPWTGYAFTLDMIRICVDDAIRAGTPQAPGALLPRAFGLGWSDPPSATVPTRWTAAYRGRRDLGVVRSTCDGCNQREAGGESCAAHVLVGEGLTVRQRQRAANAEFQAAHLERRRYGKAAYHAMRTANAQRADPLVHPDEH